MSMRPRARKAAVMVGVNASTIPKPWMTMMAEITR